MQITLRVPVSLSEPHDSRSILKRFIAFTQQCVYCEKQFPEDKNPLSTKRTLSFDHIKPDSFGGERVLENGLLSCRTCNTRRDTQPVIDYLLARAPHKAQQRRVSSTHIQQKRLTAFASYIRLFLINRVSLSPNGVPNESFLKALPQLVAPYREAVVTDAKLAMLLPTFKARCQTLLGLLQSGLPEFYKGPEFRAIVKADLKDVPWELPRVDDMPKLA